MMSQREALIVLLLSSVKIYGLLLDEPCTDDTACQEAVTNSVCDVTDSVCTCALSYKPDGNDTCVRKVYKDPCIGDDDCGPGNDTICYYDNECRLTCNWCKCNHELGYQYDDTRKQCVQVCANYQLYCNNGNCVNQTLRDNGIDDCDDNTDEGPYKYCGEKWIFDSWTQSPTWLKQYKCKNGGGCTPMEFVRDTGADCNDQSDEYKVLGTECNYNVPTDPYDCPFWMQDSVCTSNYVCACRSGAYSNADKLGCTVRVLGDSCMIDSDCEDAVTNSECDDVSNICVCDQRNGATENKTCLPLATTSTMVQQDTSTSNTVEPSATTTESTSNTVQLDTATATVGRTKDFSSSFTIGTTNSIAFQPTTDDLKTPEINSSWPSFGPAAGGTWVTVTGIDLPVEYKSTISIGDVTCDTKMQNSTNVIGITKGLHLAETQFIGKPLPVSLTYDTMVIRSTHVFTYRENPVIDEVHPKESIIGGGTLLTVRGAHLDSVAVVWMEVIMILKSLKSSDTLVYNESRTIYATECQKVNETQMYCPTPKLDILSGFPSQSLKPAQTKRDIHRQINTRKTITYRSMDIQTLQRRLKRENVKLEYSNDGDILEFYIGFRLDGVHDYEKFTTIDVYTDPAFSLESTVFTFKADERLTFNGNGLDQGITVFDYAITIGKEDCVGLELLSNSLSCYPPQIKPAMGDWDDTGDPQITIHIGLNLQHFAGYLHYPDAEDIAIDMKIPLYIIIPATVIPAVVVIIVIAVVCEVKMRRGCCQRQD